MGVAVAVVAVVFAFFADRFRQQSLVHITAFRELMRDTVESASISLSI
jgi:hypothetical protein